MERDGEREREQLSFVWMLLEMVSSLLSKTAANKSPSQTKPLARSSGHLLSGGGSSTECCCM